MLFTTHLLVGAAIGKTAGNPAIGFIIGYISHHIFDYIPHYDPGSLLYKEEKEKNTPWKPHTYFMVILDVALGMGTLTIIGLNSSEAANLIAGGFGGVLPDLIDNVPIAKELFRKTKFGKKFHQLHEGMHNTLPINNMFIGLMIQIVIAGIMLIYIGK